MISCPICSSKNLYKSVLIDTPDRFELACGVNPVEYKRYWYLCEKCLTAVNSLPNSSISKIDNIRSRYYEIDFEGSSLLSKYQRILKLPDSQSDNRSRVNRILSFMKGMHANRHSVVDIGAGLGVFLSQFISSHTFESFACSAVEPDPAAFHHLQSLDLFPVYQNYTDIPKDNPPTLITLNKVLEHIQSPLDFLKSILKRFYSEDLVFYVEVPDILSLRYCEPDDNILGSLHCHLYDPLGLVTLLSSCSLSTILCQRIREPSGKYTVFAFASPSKSMTSSTLDSFK